MTSNFQRESAKIYHFPVRGRFAVPAPYADLKPAATPVASQVAQVAVGESWYHEEAIQEAERTRKN